MKNEHPRCPPRWRATGGALSASLLVLLSLTSSAASAANKAPVARASAVQTKNSFSVAFSAAKSTDADGTIASYAWDFGDGERATGVSATHAYARAGTYAASLVVTDNAGAKSTVAVQVKVDAAPTPVVTWSQFPGEPILVFGGGDSTDSDGYITAWTWNFGDGKTGSGMDVSHMYAKPGDYTITFTVKDNFGNTTAKSFTATVVGKVNANPVAQATGTVTGLSVAFDGSASSDPDGSIASYSWNFGDGKTGSGARVTHAYAKAGDYTAVLTVKDNQGASATMNVPVSVAAVNQAPVAKGSAVVTPGSLNVAFDGRASSDPDGSIASYSWSFGDGSSGSGATASHAYAAAGQYTATLVVTDNQGASSSIVVPVLVGAPTTGSTPWVTGYYAGWFWADYQPQNIDMTSMTHVVFGRVAPGGDGATMGGKPGEIRLGAGTAHTPGQLPAGVTGKSVEDYLVERAHNAGSKAILMLGGNFDGPGFVQSTTNSMRPVFIKNLLDYLVAHDYDGVDVDWEDSIDTPQQTGQLIAFLKELKAAAAQRARYAAPRQLVVSFPTYIMNMNYETVPAWKVEVAGLVDQFNIMSYNINFPFGGWTTWHFAPIGGQSGLHPSDISSTVQAYADAGIPKSKIGIGIGFFGNSYAPPVTGPDQTVSDLSNNDSEWSYANLVNGGFLSAGTYTWDPVAQMGYRTYEGGFTGHAEYNTATSGMLTYEDPASIAAKGKWVRANSLGGTILWTINYGSPDGLNNPLLNAVKQAFILGGANTPPNARMTSKLEGTTSLTFRFDANQSTDAENNPVASYSWDFGDGSTASGSSLLHTFATEGKYKVTLKVTDAHGVSDTLTVMINAEYPPPPDVLPPLETIPASTSAKPWVMGYYAGWSWDASQDPRTVDYSAMTHLAFGRVAPGAGTLGGQPGQVVLGGGTSHQQGLVEGKSAEDYMIGRAHAAGVKAILMLGGMGDGAGFLRSTDPRVRPTFVTNLLNYLEQHDYDGIDVDWEDVLDTELAHFRLTALIADLRAGAKQRARWQGAGKDFIITFPGYALNVNTDHVSDFSVTIASIVDQYNLMSYGMGYNADGWTSTTFAPLEGQTSSHPMDISSSIQMYADKGVPRKKLGLGIGFYGFCYRSPVTAPNQPVTDVFNSDTDWSYTELNRLGFLTSGTYHWDDVAKMGYRSYSGGGKSGHGVNCGMVSYEDQASIAAKGAWVKNPQTAIGGAIIWLINHGTTTGRDNPLLDAVKHSFIE
ncbi:PKD domain-containing protein [Massilia arenosa]|uniref:chitinase n=1 Tax=Zemynaea arenosa TaxID=2561931 RepID=A0A4Y9SCR7_9BURK|nr:PKD domain-containing protein [Massilia arenosa]TFW18234.1 PKD domain-containing protein [Massilia arenosa]